MLPLLLLISFKGVKRNDFPFGLDCPKYFREAFLDLHLRFFEGMKRAFILTQMVNVHACLAEVCVCVCVFTSEIKYTHSLSMDFVIRDCMLEFLLDLYRVGFGIKWVNLFALQFTLLL